VSFGSGELKLRLSNDQAAEFQVKLSSDSDKEKESVVFVMTKYFWRVI